MHTVCSIVLLVIAFLLPRTAYAADAATLYQTYLKQFDTYRITLNNFKIARAEYLKFKTLTSQETALTQTQQFLKDRSLLIRAYLEFLHAKLGESVYMDPSSKTLFSTLIGNEVQFLQNHSALMSSINSLEDADGVSQQLSSHYTVLQSSIYQTIVGLTTAELTRLDTTYYKLFEQTYQLFQTNRSMYTAEKQSTLERWFLQIQNKRSLYQQKMDTIKKENDTLKSSSMDEVANTYASIQKEFKEARQYLSEGTAFLQEVITALQYRD